MARHDGVNALYRQDLVFPLHGLNMLDSDDAQDIVVCRVHVAAAALQDVALRRDAAAAVRRVPTRMDGHARIRDRIDHRHNHAVCA